MTAAKLNCLARYAPLSPSWLPSSDLNWLRGAERREYERIADAARARQWLAGRLLARAVLHEAGVCVPSDSVQVLTRNERGLGAAPRLLQKRRPLDVSLSIAHSDEGVLVALNESVSLGVDVCRQVPTSEGFLRLWFSAAEQSWIAADRRRAATVWGIKEAVYKAVGNGAGWNPRDVEVEPGALELAAKYHGQTVEPLSIETFEVDGQVAVVAVRAEHAAIDFQVCELPLHDEFYQSLALCL
jgi:phosphopantetheinyl transferase